MGRRRGVRSSTEAEEKVQPAPAKVKAPAKAKAPAKPRTRTTRKKAAESE